MNNDFLVNDFLVDVVGEAALVALRESAPGLAAALEDLRALGEPVKAIEERLGSLESCPGVMCAQVVAAYEHLVRHEPQKEPEAN